jgi:hypothetical protein
MNATSAGLSTLERAAADIGHAESPSDVFRAWLEGSRAAVPRAGIFLSRGGAWKGWGCVGYGTESARGFRALTVPLDSAWIETLLALPGGPSSPTSSREGIGDFGQPPADEAVAVIVRIGGRPLALLVGERASGESPWQPESLRILGHAARLRLELDLAWRRLRQATRPDGPAPEAPVPAETAASPILEEPHVPGAPPEPEPTAMEVAEPAPKGSRALDDARRFARLVATEIRLYNEEDVVLGRRHRDLAQRLADPLAQGRSTFARRFPSLGEDGIRVLEEAYVQVLAGGDETLLPRP